MIILRLFLMAALFFPPFAARAAGDAVILMYHRFGEEKYPTTNVRLDQFEAHLEELASGAYHVLPLATIITAWQTGKALPERTVAITIDDAFASVFTEAAPRLASHGFAYTVFVSTRVVDQGDAGYMSWQQMRQLRDQGASFANHTVAHRSMLDIPAAQNRQEIIAANQRLKAELGEAPAFFSYPYGEFSTATREIVKNAGFSAAFAQFSSVASAGADRFALPRFAINEHYGGLARFRLIAGARALPVIDQTPHDPLITRNPPAFGFTIARKVPGLRVLACYPSHMEVPARLERLGERRIEVRFDEPFPKGRARINCTMPGPGGRWYWFGAPFFIR
jgi:peptidoglycan/xylan/chitin deacetylase (PgdA/CDA1 family)